MTEKLPHPNFHSSELLDRAVKSSGTSVTSGAADSTEGLCALGVDLQASLRAKGADSPRINNDPAFRLVMVALGERMELANFTDFSQAYEKMQAQAKETGPVGQRARWAEMAQDGAVNLTPMANSLFTAVKQVVVEGGLPEKDGSVRLLAHQMGFIAQTHGLTLQGPEAQDLRSWCSAAQAALSIADLPCAKKTLAPTAP